MIAGTQTPWTTDEATVGGSTAAYDGALPNTPPATSIVVYSLATLTASIIGGLLAQDWIGFVALLVLFAFWRILTPREGPPVVAMAFTYQWVQVCIGVFYYGMTGRYSPTMYLSDYRPMVIIGIGCICALFGGIALATRFQDYVNPAMPRGKPRGLTDRQLLIGYLFLLVTSGALNQWGGRFPGLYQGATVLGYFRYTFLFLIFRRISQPRVRWTLFVPLLGFEVLLGFTGFFADFREPIIFALLALLEVFDSRKIRHWMVLAGSVCVALVLAVTWTAIKPEYRSSFAETGSRSQRLSFINMLTKRLVANGMEPFYTGLDATVDRLWVVYYPALAVQRVPAVIPHTGGEIMWSGIVSTITPRLFFPNKPALVHDSEKVRRFSGTYVAGEEEGSSIAFGYAAELWVDFGAPGMFYPLLIAGFVFGLAFRRISRAIRYRDIAVSVTVVEVWTCVYLFEQSWARMLGFSLTTLLYMTAAGIMLDRYVAFKRRTLEAMGRV
jgi:hypothetical protein